MIVSVSTGVEPASPPPNGMAETPELLAKVAVNAIGRDGAKSWLDPSAGSGNLIKAALDAGVPAKTFLAIDLLTNLPSLKNLGVESRLGTDFLRWAKTTQRRFDRVIANPPYVRVRELGEQLYRPAVETRFDEITISPNANYWVAFVVASIKLLNPGGCIAFILPAAWEYADYASVLRAKCASMFRELDVHRVSVPMFDDVNDGSILLVARGYGEPTERDPRVLRYPSLKNLSETVCMNHVAPNQSKKLRQRLLSAEDGQVRIGDIARIQIGAVTGDANYFLFSESQRIERDLPPSSVVPVLSKSNHITDAETRLNVWHRLRDQNKRVWLFSPTKEALVNRRVRDYLELPVEEGGCNKEARKIMDRNPWYRVKIPGRFDGFLSGMSQIHCWVALNRMPNLTISNTLYGMRFKTNMNMNEKAAWCLAMLSSSASDSRASLAREYPQGLLKLEPRDFENLLVPRPNSTENALKQYRQVVRLIKSGRRSEAEELVDDWLM